MSIKEKVAQIQSMERELEETRAAAVKEAIAEVQTLINLFNITASDVRFPEPGAKPRAKRSAGPVMYAFGDKTWTGHGRTPNWIKDLNFPAFHPLKSLQNLTLR